ncbi:MULTISPECIES: DUF4123 domain-containing protein [Photorhabdus]|uniref:DUF4123 domain-containing protein n=1 Tax=Photorhabdus hindustanensis TaxID=2918802 RepID=A0A2S8Q089_9GAMM|nr:DUF4123 domain-containing protein [Photorhabdus hindustanensis]PQQ24282.1 DUF4123 domain-containing protein [Photorhabdus luminescens]PQQ25024.1 DUF4123 domain-containing protein [Photorhabdus hindustanensis]
MNDHQIADWIASLASSVTEIGISCIDMIVDQSGGQFPLIPALKSFSSEMDWCSLFQGLPEEVVTDKAPILIRIDLTHAVQRQWMSEIMMRLGRKPVLLVLCSSWSFDRLSQHLIQCVDAAYAGKGGILRFYDPRIFPVLFSHVLDKEQQQQFFRPVLFWSWLDRDGAPHVIWSEGHAEPVDETVQKIDLTDEQLEHLSCVSDAHILMLKLSNQDEYSAFSREQLFDSCYALMVEASGKDILLDGDRESFVLKHLKSRLLSLKSVEDEKTTIEAGSFMPAIGRL